ncbi:MAG TPA: type II toxin-antitoxin system RelE/ParE family toxin [Stellaceae bacterium]|jgi:plasmid stabilization system protein ParE
MNFRVIRSLRAAGHIRDIALYLTEFSPPAAQRFLLAMRHAHDQLSAFPNSGSAGTVSETRRLVVGDYIVSYRLKRETVQIVAVRHGKRRDVRF